MIGMKNNLQYLAQFQKSFHILFIKHFLIIRNANEMSSEIFEIK